MPGKLKILVSAYACSPGRGSEPGMGWNFVIGLSRYHEVHVISEEKFKLPVDEYLAKYTELKENLKFYFIVKKRNKWLRKIWPPSYYRFYRRWQQKAFKLAQKLDQAEDFDIIHQLNMVGYREPGYLWKISKPFVWGPVGGLENSPWKFIPSLGLKGCLFYCSRNIINFLQRQSLSRPRKAANHSHSAIIAATTGNALLIRQLWGKETTIINEVGQTLVKQNGLSKRGEADAPLRIIWSGLHTPGKNLPLLLNSLATVSFAFECHILGSGEMTSRWEKKSMSLGINKYCKCYGWLERGKALEVMQSGHVFCITSISDLTSTVTLEALSCGLPVICLDHCGFSDVITENCGVKIPVTNPSKAARDFAGALERIYNDEHYRQRLSEGALDRASEFTWENKIEMINSIYSSLLEE